MRPWQTVVGGSLAVLLATIGSARATVLTFARNSSGAVPINNSDLDVPYGSNVTAANIIGATDGGEGFTPNVSLVWAPTGGTIPQEPDIDILEFHSAATFSAAGGPAFTVPVLQLDVDISNHTFLPEHPTVNFIPEPGFAVRFHELKIGNATDQVEAGHPWTIHIFELPSMTEVDSYTTATLNAGNSEIATFDYTGLPGVSYQMQFDDGPLDCTSSSCHHPRTAIDNLRFSQISTAGIAGDYNDNGTVDAADYVLWRNTLGQSGVGLPADGDGNGTVQPADFTFWRARFGNTSGSGAGLGESAVPEPGVGGLIGVLLCCLMGSALRGARRKTATQH